MSVSSKQLESFEFSYNQLTHQLHLVWNYFSLLDSLKSIKIKALPLNDRF